MTSVDPPFGPRVAAWERRTEWPLAAAAVLFLAVYAWPILDRELPHGVRTACSVGGYVIWAIFIVEYAARIILANQRGRYVVHHALDLAVVSLPILRPLRLLRLVLLIRVLNRRATDSLQGRIAVYVSGSAVLLIFVAALAELDAERHAPKSNITGFGDAMWWAMTTVTTVGYGDRYPVTTTGRLVAVGLMIGGIALIGAVTAGVAAWLIERVRAVEEGAQAVTRQDIAELAARLDALIAARDLRPQGSRSDPRADEYKANVVAPSIDAPAADTP